MAPFRAAEGSWLRSLAGRGEAHTLLSPLRGWEGPFELEALAGEVGRAKGKPAAQGQLLSWLSPLISHLRWLPIAQVQIPGTGCSSQPGPCRSDGLPLFGFFHAPALSLIPACANPTPSPNPPLHPRPPARRAAHSLPTSCPFTLPLSIFPASL